MTTLKIGDRVKVAAFEGTVTAIGGMTGLPYVQRDGEQAFVRVYPDLVEVLAPPVKVGDTIYGADAYEALPPGAVATDGRHVVIRTAVGFVDHYGDHYGPHDMHARRTLVHLPE